MNYLTLYMKYFDTLDPGANDSDATIIVQYNSILRSLFKINVRKNPHNLLKYIPINKSINGLREGVVQM